MKPLKSAQQHNVTIDTDHYHDWELEELHKIEGVATIEEATGMNSVYFGKELRVWLNHVKDLKVVYDKEFGYYATVAVMETGETIYVNL